MSLKASRKIPIENYKEKQYFGRLEPIVDDESPSTQTAIINAL